MVNIFVISHNEKVKSGKNKGLTESPEIILFRICMWMCVLDINVSFVYILERVSDFPLHLIRVHLLYRRAGLSQLKTSLRCRLLILSFPPTVFTISSFSSLNAVLCFSPYLFLFLKQPIFPYYIFFQGCDFFLFIWTVDIVSNYLIFLKIAFLLS